MSLLKRPENILSSLLLMYLAEKFAADADALRGPLRGALRVKVLTSCQILPEPLIYTQLLHFPPCA